MRLRGFNLAGLNLNGISFSGLDLAGVKLGGVTNFDPTDVSSLFGADLRNVSFASGSEQALASIELRFANLSSLDLSGFNLSGQNLKGVNLSGANLSGVDLGGALLQGLDLARVQNLDLASTAGSFFDSLTRLPSGLPTLTGGELAEVPDVFTPYDGPTFSFSGGFDPDTLKVNLGVDLHLRQLLEFAVAFDVADFGLSSFDLGPLGSIDVTLDGEIDLKAGLAVDFSAEVGVKLDQIATPSQAAFLTLNEMQAGAGVKATFDLNAGLGPIVGSVIGGNAQVVAAVDVQLSDQNGSVMGEEIALGDLGGITVEVNKIAPLDVQIPVDIAVGSFSLSGLGLVPELTITDNDLFSGPGVTINSDDFIDDLKRAGLGLLTTDTSFLIDGLQQVVDGLQDFATDDMLGACPSRSCLRARSMPPPTPYSHRSQPS